MTETGAAAIRTRHGADFERCGVPADLLNKLIMQVATSGDEPVMVVGHDRPTRVVEFGGQQVPVALSVAGSGYVISAHPEPLSRVDGSRWPPLGSRPLRVRLGAEWGAGPLWITFGPEESVAANYLPEEVRDVLALPPDLLLDIARWDHDYQRILDENYPPDSKFPSEEAALRFRRTGFALAKQLRAALPPEVTVEYAENFSDRILTVQAPQPAVATHPVRPDRLPGLDPRAGAVHVDLPHSLVNAWAQQLGRGPERLLELDVRDIPSARDLANAIAPGVDTIVEAITRAPAKALVLTKVEQLDVRNRPVLVEFLHALPKALTARNATGTPLHVALVDLSSDRAEATLAELHNAPSGEIETPVPVFAYPAMA
ncbi:hypothetical protein [Saccharopolyspora rosea]|uniref:hypothetical protein n=1 Tax=Saccharopolyspora rosea TaxID=524884 RepID=UPI0021D85E37|nr:hypothetical protein [Saccharopolyspora rosea]